MNFHFRRHFALATFGLGLGWMAWASWAQLKPGSNSTISFDSQGKPVSRAQKKPPSKEVAEIRDYKFWQEVTQKPVAMDPAVAMMCALPNGFSRSTAPTVRGTQGPHRKKYIRVYVNALASEPMMAQKRPRFPVGSVVVKEKLPLIESKNPKTGKRGQKVGTKPELLTVMIKREKGYDAANGDWEYLVTDGVGKKVTQRGKIEACQGCHRPYEKTDYMVRSYLPAEISKALRDADAGLAIKK